MVIGEVHQTDLAFDVRVAGGRVAAAARIC